jgi:hypothetical protein
MVVTACDYPCTVMVSPANEMAYKGVGFFFISSLCNGEDFCLVCCHPRSNNSNIHFKNEEKEK